MVTTFQALGVFMLALWPGAAYTFALERQLGAFGVGLSDRLIRFFASSVVFQALFAGPTVSAYRSYVVSGRLQHANVNSWAVEGIALAYVVIPIAAGSIIGAGHKQGWRWATLIGGEAPEPRAWDFLWRSRPTAIIRMKLKSGTWLAGLFGNSYNGKLSYASGFREHPEPADLYLSLGVQVDPDSGAFIRDDDGALRWTDGDSGLLIRWDEIEYLEFHDIGT